MVRAYRNQHTKKMAIRIDETRLSQFVKGLTKDEYRKLRLTLELDPCKEHTDNQKDHTVQLLRSGVVACQQQMLELTGCTSGTYRSYKTYIVDALLFVLSSSHKKGIFQWLRDIEKAWVLTDLGEYRQAYDLADSIRKVSLEHERGAVTRLALNVVNRAGGLP